MTPDEAAKKAVMIVNKWSKGGIEGEDIAERHFQLDGLMCEVLEQHGYGELVQIFKKTHKWWS